MIGVLELLHTKKPRERSGARTSSRYEFQANVSILKILDLHEAGHDYRAVFDYFDDLMILDGSTKPQRLRFYQIKTRSNGRWTVSRVTKRTPGESPPSSIIGKMYKNAFDFADVVEHIAFVTNAGFDFRLKEGFRTSDDHVRIEGEALHPDELVMINTALDAEFPTPREPACNGILLFERTNLPLREQAVFMTGRLVQHLEGLGEAEHVPVQALYEALYRHVVAKTSIAEEFPTVQDLLEKKTLCRADIEALTARAVRRRRFLENWPLIQHELLAGGESPVRILRLQNAALRYLSDRARGEHIATQFNTIVQAAADAQKDAIANCERILDISMFLRITLECQSLPYQGDDLYAALVVEAYEAING